MDDPTDLKAHAAEPAYSIGHSSGRESAWFHAVALVIDRSHFGTGSGTAGFKARSGGKTLIGAGLCLRSLFNARSIDAGFEIDNRLAATLGLSSLGYAESKGKVFFSTLVERTETLPEVQSASLASYLPLESTRHGIGVTIEGYAPPAGQDAIHLQVTDIGPHYFRTMGTPLLRGREFTRQDDESAPRVAIINEAMAKRYWPGRDPLGRRLSIENESYEIVGVVKTGKYRTLGENALPYLYRSFLQHYHPKATLVAHTAGDPRGLLPSIRREVQSLDPNLALIKLATLQEHLALALFPAYATGILLSAFGLVALILAVVGIGRDSSNHPWRSRAGQRLGRMAQALPAVSERRSRSGQTAALPWRSQHHGVGPRPRRKPEVLYRTKPVLRDNSYFRSGRAFRSRRFICRRESKTSVLLSSAST